MLKSQRDKIENQMFDAIVIGGGSVGFGIAVDLITRGFSVLLLEREDYAKGTSSRSTKILHGGVRYLAQGNLALVKEALNEKRYFCANAPHLARNMNFVIPADSLASALFYKAGMFAYDGLAFFRQNLSRLFSYKTAQRLLPNIKDRKKKYIVQYSDGQFDDARMIISLLRTFDAFGGVACNYAEVVSIDKDDAGKVSGVRVNDKLTKQQYRVFSKCVFNATGIFADDILNMDQGYEKQTVVHSQGIHLVIDKSKYSSDYAMLIPKTADGRVLFFIPWYHKVILGTTDTLVDQATYDPAPLSSEIELILNAANEYLKQPLELTDIHSVYTGIRPLVKPDEKGDGQSATKSISREEHIEIASSNLVSVIGGKWTTYRHIAEKTINLAIKHGLLVNKICITKKLCLYGSMSSNKLRNIPDGYKFYGVDFAKISKMDEFKELLHDDLPITKAQVIWAIDYEHAVTVDDVLARRTRCLFINAEASLEIAPQVAAIMQEHLQQDDAWFQQQLDSFNDIAQKYFITNWYQ